MRHVRTLSGMPGLAGIAAALLLTVLAVSIGWLALRPHATPPPAAAHTSGFVAARALAHVHALAQAPRPAGGGPNGAARDYLVARLRALGLQPEVQTETVQTTSLGMMRSVHLTLATVHNIVVHLPGRRPATDERSAIVVTAHYDSTPATLGAADGAASAAAMLETLRVLRAGPAPLNDLLFVFTDADSGQALGTRAFMASHPWARRARLLLRFDNPGHRGPLVLADATHADGAALAAFARAAPSASGTSFMAELYAAIRPRAADALLAGNGAALLQFATRDGTLGPGAVQDIPQRLSSASLQHEGDTMLALLRDLGGRPLPPAGMRGQVFFGVPGLGIVHYPYALVWPLALLACALTAAACIAGMRRARVDGVDILHAGFGFLFMGTAVTFLVHLVREAMPGLRWRWDVGVLAGGDGVRWQVLAFALLLGAGFIVGQRRLQERRGVLCVQLGVNWVATLALLAVSWSAPGASYLLAWPLLALQGVLLVSLSGRAGRHTLAALALAALPAVVLMPPALRDSLALLSPDWLVLPSALVFSLLGLCGMLLAEAGARFVVRPLLVAAAAAGGLAWLSVPQPSALQELQDLPAPNQLVYYKDAQSWRAFWLYPPVPLDPWTRSVFPNTMHPYQLPYLFGPSSKPVWYAAAPRNDAIAYPDLIIEKVEWIGDIKHVEFLLRSKNRAPRIALRVDGAGPARSSVNGRVLTDTAYGKWSLDLHGMEDRELRFAFDFYGDPKFTVFVQEYLQGVPERDLPPRRAGLRPALLPLTGTTISADILRFE